MDPERLERVEYLLTAIVCVAAAMYLIWQLWLR